MDQICLKVKADFQKLMPKGYCISLPKSALFPSQISSSLFPNPPIFLVKNSLTKPLPLNPRQRHNTPIPPRRRKQLAPKGRKVHLLDGQALEGGTRRPLRFLLRFSGSLDLSSLVEEIRTLLVGRALSRSRSLRVCHREAEEGRRGILRRDPKRNLW